MNAAIITTAIQSAHLHVRHAQGHNERKFQPMAGISYRHNAITRAVNPAMLRRIKRHSEGAFSCLSSSQITPWGVISTMAAGVGTRTSGRTLSPVLTTRTSPPPKPSTEVADSVTTAKESTMNTSPKGTLPENFPVFILRATLEKRVRRELAKQNRKLLKSRPGTPAYREYGQYAIENDRRTVLETHLDLVKLARDLGVMQAHEYLDPHSDWRYYVVRHTTQIIGGKTIHSFDRLSRNFPTRAEAERHADRVKDDGPIGICGFDAREGQS